VPSGELLGGGWGGSCLGSLTAIMLFVVVGAVAVVGAKADAVG